MKKSSFFDAAGKRIRLFPILIVLTGLVVGGCGSTSAETRETGTEADTVAEMVTGADTVTEAASEDETAMKPATETAMVPQTATASAVETAEGAGIHKAAAEEEPTENAAEAITTIIGPDGVKLSNDPSDFVLLSDAVPDAILEIRYYSTYNFVGDRIDGYEEPIAFLTEEAADALREVSDDVMEKGYRLKIYDAYRPQEAVTHFVNWAKDSEDIRMKEYFYPDLDKDSLFPQGYIAEHSGHSRGSTVDLTLFDMTTEKEADMGGTFDYFGELSHPDYSGITQEQYENRMILRKAMIDHGFKPNTTEWWHFTLRNEPYPDTYFTFPVNSDSIEQ